MEATIDHFHSVTMNDFFFLKDSDIRTMYLPLVPRFQKYLKDTEGIRRDIRNVLITRAIATINDENIIKELEFFENRFKEFDDKLNSYTFGGDILARVAEIGNFLNHAEGAYVVLKGRHYLHPIGALYGPEDPPEICV